MILTPSLVTGFPLIDQQHEQLFNIIDTLEIMASSDGSFRAVAEGTRKHLTPATGTVQPVVVRKVIERLMYYADIHFQYEESLMSYASPALTKLDGDQYEDFAKHVCLHHREHHSFSTTVTEYHKQVTSYCTLSPASIYVFVHHWVTEHIEKTDQAMCVWLRRSDAVAG